MKCKYCGKDHSHIGMTIIPSCVDERIEELKRDRMELSTALADAISTYGPKKEILVTEERQEKWREVLGKHGVEDWGFKVGEDYVQ